MRLFIPLGLQCSPWARLTHHSLHGPALTRAPDASANGNAGHFCGSVNTPLTRGTSSQPVPQSQASSGLCADVLVSCHPKQGGLSGPANLFSTFLFLVFYSLFYKSFLPSAPHGSPPNGDCPCHEMLMFVCIIKIVFYHHGITCTDMN